MITLKKILSPFNFNAATRGFNLKENQIGGCSMGKVDCKLWEDKYGFGFEVQDE